MPTIRPGRADRRGPSTATTCYRYTGDKRYLDHAEKVADFMLNDKNMPADLVPYWDYDAPNIPNEPRDASTAAVLASALYEMYTYTGNELYKQKADRMIESLSSPAYRAPVGENGGFLLMTLRGASRTAATSTCR